MRRTLLTALFGLALGGVANAADVTMPVHSWDGFYAGATLGYGWARGAGGSSSCASVQDIIAVDGVPAPDDIYDFSDFCDAERNGWASASLGQLTIFDDTSGTEVISFADRDIVVQSDDDGWNFGAQIGLNHQMSSRFVVGLEADARITSGIKSSSEQAFDYETVGGIDVYYGNGLAQSDSEIEWMTTLRARLGMLFGADNQILAYATGGAALARVSSSFSADFDEAPGGCGDCGFGNVSGGDDFYQTGLVVGGGVEYALTETVSISAEYLYTKFYGQEQVSARFYGFGSDGQFDTVQDVGFDDIQMINAKINFHF